MNDILKHFKIGQATDTKHMTGCTVIVSETGAVGGVSVRGGSPNTRDTDALKSENNRKHIHAVTLSGGSGFGLSASDGVINYLESKGIGRDVGIGVVPNVCGASLFDLGVGSKDVRPDKTMGLAATQAAFENSPFQNGNYGAGTGATIGSINGRENAMKGGIGFSSLSQGKLTVAAVIAVNAVGDVFDTQRNQLMAGARVANSSELIDSETIFLKNYRDLKDLFSGNTVIGAILTNATFTKPQANKLADIGHNGFARAIRPAHTMFDGDTLFALCAGEVEATFEAVSILAVRAVEEAILTAVKEAETFDNFLAYRDL